MTDKPKLYSVSEIQGKGLGCVATTEIKKGTLILREGASFHHFGHESLDKAYFEELFQGYLTLSTEDRETYLSLANCFSDQRAPSPSSIRKMAKVLKYLEDSPIDLPREEAKLVYQIYHTNGFHNGIFFEMSRFNHSCMSNAEYFWNEDTKTRDLRAIRKIRKCDEITLKYFCPDPEQANMTRDERRYYLGEIYHFHCNCIGCDLTEEELKIQNERCAEYRKTWAHYKAIKKVNQLMWSTDTSNEIDDLKAIYKLAKDLKIIGLREILLRILEEGFDASCYRCIMMIMNGHKRDDFMKNIECFASAGYEISKVVHGPEHSDTLAWQKRKQDPIAFFQSEYGCGK